MGSIAAVIGKHHFRRWRLPIGEDLDRLALEVKPGYWVALVACSFLGGCLIGNGRKGDLRAAIEAKEVMIDSLNTVRASQWAEIRIARDSIAVLSAQVSRQRPTRIIVRETLDDNRRHVRSLSTDSLAGLWSALVRD